MARKEYREKHKKSGLCTICPAAAKVGRSRCAKHLEEARERSLKRYYTRKSLEATAAQ